MTPLPFICYRGEFIPSPYFVVIVEAVTKTKLEWTGTCMQLDYCHTDGPQRKIQRIPVRNGFYMHFRKRRRIRKLSNGFDTPFLGLIPGGYLSLCSTAPWPLYGPRLGYCGNEEVAL